MKENKNCDCSDIIGVKAYVYQNSVYCSELLLAHKLKLIYEYADTHGYEIVGSTKNTHPLNWGDEDYHNLISYCQEQGITKLLIDNYYGLAHSIEEAENIYKQLASEGISVEFTDSQCAYAWEKYKDEPHTLEEPIVIEKINGSKDFERNDLEIDRDIQIDDDPHRILAFVEIWCIVKEKFNIPFYENSVLDMYATYDPFEDTLTLKCVVDYDDENMENFRFEYKPTEGEAQLIKDMIAETLQQEFGETPQEFCEKAIKENQGISLGGM